jgi:uncharacterized protein
MLSPAILCAAILILLPYLAEAFFAGCLARFAAILPGPVRRVCPAILSLPYALVAASSGIFRWNWFALYASLPVAISILLWQASEADPGQHGHWLDFLVLATLGLAVDLRWFEPAWPARLTVFGKLLLLDAGIYGFLAIRKLHGAGFDLRLRLRDIAFGLREFLFYVPIAIALGLSLSFLHFHALWPPLLPSIEAFVFTFFAVAVPEEFFFRGWLQNLLERRLGRSPALLVTAILFGLSHWNKRALHFNWRYVLLAAVAGIFYGRAWRQERRVGASAITHASVDTIWSLWFR